MKRLVVALLLTGLLGACGKTVDLGTTNASSPATKTITYKVDTLARSASLTISNASGATEQLTVKTPWTQTFTVEPGAFVYLSAQSNRTYDWVECSITSDGQAVQSAHSDGDYTIASCSGSA